jgi:hypothetical protein
MTLSKDQNLDLHPEQSQSQDLSEQSQSQPQDHPPDLQSVFTHRIPYRVAPFDSKLWQDWQAAWTLPLSPRAVREQEKQNYLALGGSARHFALYSPLTDAFYASEATYESWVNLEKQYSPRHLFKALNYSSTYTRWQTSNKIPDPLDIREATFLMQWFDRLSKRQVFGKLDLETYRHPVPPGEWVKFKSKVGNVYGTWRVKACLSESEATRDNPRYEVECMACGHEAKDFSYRRLSHPCPACEKAGRSAKILSNHEGKPISLTIWQMPDGVTVGNTMPEGALAKAVQTKVGEIVPWERLQDRDILPKDFQKVEPKPTQAEVQKEDNQIFSLLDDMPDL